MQNENKLMDKLLAKADTEIDNSIETKENTIIDNNGKTTVDTPKEAEELIKEDTLKEAEELIKEDTPKEANEPTKADIAKKANTPKDSSIKKNEADYLLRRKRINRIKTAIIILAILLMILPTILCIILGIQVGKLKNQVNELSMLHGTYEAVETIGDNYAYAAEITPDDLNETDASQSSNNTSQTDDPDNSDAATTQEDASAQEDGEAQEASSSDENSIPKEDAGTNAEAEQQGNEATDTTEDQSNAEENKDDKDNGSNNEDKGIYAGKKVYLTFDDGPSAYTDEILDILAEYNIKAAFFVVGKTDTKSKERYKRIVEEGHTLGMHSYSHQYSKIYNSVEDFDKDFTKLQKLLYDTTGYMPTIFRFPGGSDNQVNKIGMEEFIKYLNDKSIVYYDWNALNGDATGKKYTEEQLIDNVLNTVKNKKTSIVLMHDSDTKKSTAASLPELIEALIAGGAQILPLDEDVPPIQMIKADSVK